MDKVTLEVEDSVAIITNNNPAKKNAFDDEMDVALFEILAELKGRTDVRAAIWRAEGDAWSAGRDVSVIGHNATQLSHHELMTRGHRGILQIFELDIPIIVALHGWAIGGSFQRALLCDIRIATVGTRFKLPELSFGVIPDTGGISRLYQICGPGVVSDLVLTGRTMDADEALAHGIVSRIVPRESLDDEAFAMARAVAAAPAATVKMARRVIRHLTEADVRASMEDELVYQTFINKSADFAEFKAARAEERSPRYTGS
jgi:enoyl-CoA hydratase/carnithine racemase